MSQDYDVDQIIIRLLDCQNAKSHNTRLMDLTENELEWLCDQAKAIFLSQPCLIELTGPINVVGDIHGQFRDLFKQFHFAGFPPSSNYLFLGDYIDRGKQGLECIALLCAYKIKYPENFFMLRGNHECASITRVYGFYAECKARYTHSTWYRFVGLFNTLPLAAIIDEKIFCVHAGISPQLLSMRHILSLQRPSDIPDCGLMCDILWSDPDTMQQLWGVNARGVSYTFNEVTVKNFCAAHNFDLICRAHQVVANGYEFFADRCLVTIFSAPNYQGGFDNAAAIMCVDENLVCSFKILKPNKRNAKDQNMLTDRLPEKIGRPPY